MVSTKIIELFDLSMFLSIHLTPTQNEQFQDQDSSLDYVEMYMSDTLLYSVVNFVNHKAQIQYENINEQPGHQKKWSYVVIQEIKALCVYYVYHYK